MPEKFEQYIASLNSMKAIQASVAGNPQLKDALLESLEPVKCLLNSLIMQLKLKDEQFSGKFYYYTIYADSVFSVFPRGGWGGTPPTLLYFVFVPFYSV